MQKTKIIGFYGYSDSGKTSLIESLCRDLSKKGLKVVGEKASEAAKILEIQQDIKNPKEFMSNLKMALFPEDVYVFTPHGDVKTFPKGATPIDFAYSIHTDVGNQCIGARVNRSIVPLKYELQNGDTVEIITQAGHHPGVGVVRVVAVHHPRPRVRGGKVDADTTHRGQQDGVLARAGATCVAELEGVPVQVEGVAHHRHVDDVDPQPLPGAGEQRGVLAVRRAVHAPETNDRDNP